MPELKFEAYPFVPESRHVALNGANQLDVTLSTSFATVISVLVRDGAERSLISKRVEPTTGIADVNVSFTDLGGRDDVVCEVRVDAELGQAIVQARATW